MKLSFFGRKGSFIDATPVIHGGGTYLEVVPVDDLETTFTQLTKVPAIVSSVQAGASSPDPMIGIAYCHLQPAFARSFSRTPESVLRFAL
jgi:hypothetical protein